MNEPEMKAFFDGILAQIKLLTMDVKSLVAMMPESQQSEWLAIRKTYCNKMGIDDVTGEKIK